MTRLILTTDDSAAGALQRTGVADLVMPILRRFVWGPLPSDVELAAVPSDWGPSLTKYRYVYSNDRVLLVDPGSRAVVQEID